MMTGLCAHCLQPLVWAARVEVHVHVDTGIRQCDLDRAGGTTATPSPLHGCKPTTDVERPIVVPDYGLLISG